jgi:hypothetical protein
LLLVLPHAHVSGIGGSWIVHLGLQMWRLLLLLILLFRSHLLLVLFGKLFLKRLIEHLLLLLWVHTLRYGLLQVLVLQDGLQGVIVDTADSPTRALLVLIYG